MADNKGYLSMLEEQVKKNSEHSGNVPFIVSGGPFDFDICVLPGLTDVHVHLREPGFSYKETIGDGTRAAARGGFTAVCAMPNLNPVPDSVENMRTQLEIIERDAKVAVYPYAAISIGEQGKCLTDMEALASYAVAFSDDGKGVQDTGMMREAMHRAKALDKIIAAHCEDESLLDGGYIHKGEYARRNGHVGISSASEYKQVERDLELLRDTGCKYHVCHVSTAETVALIRAAKLDGLDVSCETAPHYLVFDDEMLKDEGRYKMNPPIRSARDRAALIEGVVDGTIGMIATDHAPHSAEEKSKGLKGSAMGVVGLECSFSAVYTHLVRSGVIDMAQLVKLMSTTPRERFGIKGGFEAGAWTAFNLDKKYEVKPEEFLTKGRATPFAGLELFGECIITRSGGKTVWSKSMTVR